MFRNSNNSKMCTYRLHLRYISHDTFHSASHSLLSEKRCLPCDFHLSWPTKFNQSTPEHEPQSCLVYNKLVAAPRDCKNNLFCCYDLLASQWPDVKKSKHRSEIAHSSALIGHRREFSNSTLSQLYYFKN